MKSRILRPEFFKSETLADLTPYARILFAGLWCLADREGQFAWRERQIKAEILPYDDVQINSLLEDLLVRNLLCKYEVDKHYYGFIPKFLKHQTINKHEAASQLPMHMYAHSCTCINMHLRADLPNGASISISKSISTEVSSTSELEKNLGSTSSSKTNKTSGRSTKNSKQINLDQRGKHIRMAPEEWAELETLFAPQEIQTQIPLMDQWITVESQNGNRNAIRYSRVIHNHFLFAKNWLGRNISSKVTYQGSPVENVQPRASRYVKNLVEIGGVLKVRDPLTNKIRDLNHGETGKLLVEKMENEDTNQTHERGVYDQS